MPEMVAQPAIRSDPRTTDNVIRLRVVWQECDGQLRELVIPVRDWRALTHFLSGFALAGWERSTPVGSCASTGD